MEVNVESVERRENLNKKGLWTILKKGVSGAGISHALKEYGGSMVKGIKKLALRSGLKGFALGAAGAAGITGAGVSCYYRRKYVKKLPELGNKDYSVTQTSTSQVVDAENHIEDSNSVSNSETT